MTEQHYLSELGMTREQSKAELFRLAESGAPRPTGALGALLDLYTRCGTCGQELLMLNPDVQGTTFLIEKYVEWLAMQETECCKECGYPLEASEVSA